MPGAVVVLAVPPNQADAATSALNTCNSALGEGNCAFVAANIEARWYAQMRFDPERKELISIVLFDRTPDGERVASSQLEFKERDAERERWASVGVVVAALVAAQNAANLPPPSAAAMPPPTPLPVPVPPPEPHRLWLRADLGATGGSELEGGALRFGGLARVGLAVSALPAFALASVAHTVRGRGSPELSWTTGSLGFGARVGLVHDWAALEVRTEAVVEQLSISASAAGRSESAQRTRFGPRFGLDFSGYLARQWALFGGVEVAALRPAVVIGVGGRTEDHLPLFGWGLLSGLRYDFR